MTEVRDHREATLVLRAEVTALTAVLVEKGLTTPDEFARQMDVEAEWLCRRLEEKFPGVTATDEGLTFDKRALPWMKGWKP